MMRFATVLNRISQDTTLEPWFMPPHKSLPTSVGISTIFRAFIISRAKYVRCWQAAHIIGVPLRAQHRSPIEKNIIPGDAVHKTAGDFPVQRIFWFQFEEVLLATRVTPNSTAYSSSDNTICNQKTRAFVDQVLNMLERAFYFTTKKHVKILPKIGC